MKLLDSQNKTVSDWMSPCQLFIYNSRWDFIPLEDKHVFVLHPNRVQV